MDAVFYPSNYGKLGSANTWTADNTFDVIKTNHCDARTSAGVHIGNAAHQDVAIFGASGGQGSTFYGQINGTSLSLSGAASCTTLTTSGNVLAGDGTGGKVVSIDGAASGAASGAAVYIKNAGSLLLAIGNKSAIVGGAYDASRYLYTAGAGITCDAGITCTTLTTNGGTLIATSAALTNGAAAAAGTLLNAPAAGNPTKWIPINDNGTTRYIPAW